MLVEFRHDDIQTKAAQAVGLYVVDSYRRSLVCLACLLSSFISDFQFVVPVCPFCKIVRLQNSDSDESMQVTAVAVV